VKRTSRPALPWPVYKVWPWLFWNLCAACKREFRREWGWRVLHGPICGGQYRESYVCGACAPDKRTAAALFGPPDVRPRRPPPPPRKMNESEGPK